MSGTNPDQRPLPTGWITQYDDNYKAWFYIDTKSNPPTPSWSHPLGPLPANTSQHESHIPNRRTSYSPVSPVTAGAYPSAPNQPKNPDTRPLPAGWITEYDESYKTWFYVDTNANPPTPSWVHPLGTTTKPVSSQVAAPTNTPSILTVNSGDPENPDKRPLPRGWTQQYDRTHKAFFYVDTTVLHPTPSWTHPLGPASPPPQGAPSPAHVKAASPPPPRSAVPGDHENPDKRPLPTGWITQYDSTHKAFFYVNTAVPNPVTSWIHPLGPPATSTGKSTALHIPPNPDQPKNPDTRTLPYGWIEEYAPNHKAWFYVDTKAPNAVPSWDHPLGPPATPGPATTTTSGPQNPDTRPLPPGWVSEYDPTSNAWFYVDTSKHPHVSAWTHPLGPAPPGASSAPPLSSGYGSPPGPGPSSPYGQSASYGQSAPYGQPTYGGGSSQHKAGKDQIGGLLGGFLGGKAGGKAGGLAGKYLGSVQGLVGGKMGGGQQGPPGNGPSWTGQQQPYGGAPPYTGPYRPPGQH